MSGSFAPLDRPCYALSICFRHSSQMPSSTGARPAEKLRITALGSCNE
jgi:hypothetical protein